MKLTRRHLLASAGAGVALGAAGDLRAATRDAILVGDLRTSQLVSPLGVEDLQPVLSWRYLGASAPASHKVIVASTAALLERGVGDLWDSGWQADSKAISTTYDGRALISRQTCHWQVHVRDRAGRVGKSPAARWEMGLLSAADWKAQWIAAEDAVERADREAAVQWVQGDTPAKGPRQFRLVFDSAAGEGALTVVADGVLTSLALDGKPLDIPYRDPNAFGAAPAIRVALPLTAGRHVVSAEVTAMGGFFAKPKVALAGQLRLPEGKRIGKGWTTAAGASEGWRSVGAPEDGWTQAEALASPTDFPWPAAPARMLRRVFDLKAAPSTARVYVAALGGFDLWVNDQRVSEDTLQGEPADFTDRIPYRAYDVTSLLKAGKNVVAAMVADGFYASYSAPAGRYAFGAAPRRLILQIEATVAGSDVVVTTDENWKSATAPLRYSEIYGGEDWDSRFHQPGWTKPDFADATWESVWPAPKPLAPLRARLSQAIRVTQELTPASIRKVAEDRHIVDFGQNFSGRVRLKLKGAQGLISVKHAEILTAQGEIDQRNLRAARAQDTYNLVKRGDVTLEPRFTYQGFRYVEVRGVSTLTIADARGLVLSSSLGETGRLVVENPLVQKIWNNALWSQRSNFVGIPTDCPQRDERLGWTGDAQVFWATAAFNMDVSAFTREWLRDVRAAQGPTGGYPLFAPLAKTATFGPPQATPGWADAGVTLPYVAFLHSGDRTIVDENWQAMRRYVDGVLKLNPSGLWKEARGADFGDWLAVDAKWPGDETTPKTLVATAMIARSVAQLAQLAAWTGRGEEAKALRDVHGKIKSAFMTEFVRADGSVGNDSQCSYILALGLDLVPDALKAAAANKLVADIKRRGTALSTGFLGTPLALDALADNGFQTVAYDLLLRTQAPSWGHMVETGATTMWERWNADTGDVAMNSYNHYAFGAVGAFLYTRVAGLKTLEPGFRRVRIAPLLDRRTGRVTCRYVSVRGPIGVDIQYAGAGALITVEAPAGVEAEVELPRGAQAAGGAKPTSVSGKTVFLIGHGRHVFKLSRV